MVYIQAGIISQVVTAFAGSVIEPAVVGITLGIVRNEYPTEMANHLLNNE
ncbi:hypothetical protein [Spirosoma radiotolerans]|nr:hypothetical protein [Spirosoma radiotolerans]